MPNDLNEQYRNLRFITETTGTIHEAQMDLLKTWPQLLPHVKSSEALVNTKDRLVTFWLKGGGPKHYATLFNKNRRQYDQHSQVLCKSVQFLLGSSWKVVVFDNGVREYVEEPTTPAISKEELIVPFRKKKKFKIKPGAK